MITTNNDVATMRRRGCQSSLKNMRHEYQGYLLPYCGLALDQASSYELAVHQLKMVTKMGSKILNFKALFNGVLVASYPNQAHLQKAYTLN